MYRPPWDLLETDSTNLKPRGRKIVARRFSGVAKANNNLTSKPLKRRKNNRLPFQQRWFERQHLDKSPVGDEKPSFSVRQFWDLTGASVQSNLKIFRELTLAATPNHVAGVPALLKIPRLGVSAIPTHCDAGVHQTVWPHEAEDDKRRVGIIMCSAGQTELESWPLNRPKHAAQLHRGGKFKSENNRVFGR